MDLPGPEDVLMVPGRPEGCGVIAPVNPLVEDRLPCDRPVVLETPDVQVNLRPNMSNFGWKASTSFGEINIW